MFAILTLAQLEHYLELIRLFSKRFKNEIYCPKRHNMKVHLTKELQYTRYKNPITDYLSFFLSVCLRLSLSRSVRVSYL